MENPSIQFELEFDSPIFYFDTADILGLDAEFEQFVFDAQMQLDGPAIIETSAKHYSILVPPSLHDCPMLVFWLPEVFSSELESLTAMRPTVWEISSTDLLIRRSTFEWYLNQYRIAADICYMIRSINHANPDGRIVIVFITPSRMSLRTLLVDEELAIDVNCRGMRCDANYRAVREYSCEELAAAMVESKRVGNAPLFDEDGRSIVRLAGKIYRYDQRQRWQ